MNRLPALGILLLFSASAWPQESSTQKSTAGEVKETLKESAPTPEIKQSKLTKASEYMPPATSENNQTRPTLYTKEQLEAIEKDKNWAVEGIKNHREADRLEVQKAELLEKNSLDDLLEKERKSIDARVGKTGSGMGQMKPSIETNWNTINTTGTGNSEKDLANKKKELAELGALQTNWMEDVLNPASNDAKGSNSNFDSSSGTNLNTMNSTKTGGQESLQSLQDKLDGTKPKTDTNYDYLVNTGQAQNFRKLSNDPNFQPASPGSMSSGQLGPNASVPSAPKPVNSTMDVETLRQIELQRVNAIPKPDFKEINSRIPSPGTRRF